MNIEILYFHGYNSGPNSKKVMALKNALPGARILIPEISPDPILANKQLDSFLDYWSSENAIYENLATIFVGSSLGGYWAAKKAKKFSEMCIVINPCFDPKRFLPKLGYSGNLDGYDDFTFGKRTTYFIGENDNVIDFNDFNPPFGEVIMVEGADHAFSGDSFDIVIDYIAKFWEDSCTKLN